MRTLLYLTVVCVLALAACTRTVYMPVETVRTEYKEADTTAIYERLRSWFETTRQREVSSDSVVDRQKETVVLNEKGDTTHHSKERVIYVSSKSEKELEHKVQQQDSIIDALRLQLASVKADSIPVPCPVERKLSWWEQTKMDFGGVAIGAVLCMVGFIVVRFIRKIMAK